MNEFAKRYKEYENIDLLKIIEQSEGYISSAIESAKNEIESRQLSDKEIKALKSEIEIQKVEKQRLTKKTEDIKNKISGFGSSIIKTISPFQKKALTPERLITLITFILGGVFLYILYQNFRLIQFMFIDSIQDWDFEMILFFFLLVFILVVSILFWKRKKSGWILLVTFLTCSLIIVILLLFFTLGNQPSGIHTPDLYSLRVSQITYIIFFAFLVTTLWGICKENLRTIYQVSERDMVKTFGITVGIIAITMFSILNT